MSPGSTYAFVTFMAGVLLLLGWLYATAGNPRSTPILKKSLLLFAVPIIVTLVLAPDRLFHFPLGMWAWIACEEALKAFASTREKDRINRFWLVALFGVWELTLNKPFWGPVLGQSGLIWNRLALSGFVYATALPVLMHTVTAAIYAFAFERRLWAAFIASWLVHTFFNETVDYFGPSPTPVIIETAILGLIFMTVVSRRQQTPATEDS